jgi:lipoprotein-releasing system ATP-binding protein
MSLSVEHLSKEYITSAVRLPVLRDVNLRVERGEAMAIMGPSGSGKSTLLNIVGTLDTPTGGAVRLDGRNPFTLRESAIADFRNQHIGFVFQDSHLLPQCSILENVLLPTLVSKMDPAEARKWAMKLLDRVGLSHRLDHRPYEISGGEKQRAAVARALVLHPLLVLADEPTGNLDSVAAADVGKLLLELHREENTILVVVTHSQDLAETFPRIVRMQDGRLGDGTVPLPSNLEDTVRLPPEPGAAP